MSHFAIICPEDAGHLIPVGALGNELVRRGHQVTLVGRPRAAAITEQFKSNLHELEADDLQPPSANLLWLAFRLVGAEGWIGLRNWLYWRAELTLRLVPQALQGLAVDGVLIDQTIAAGGTVAEYLGLPFVTVSSALPWNGDADVPPPFTSWGYAKGRRYRLRNFVGYATWHWFMAPTLRIINRYRKAWKLKGIERIDDINSPLAHLVQSCREFDFPRRELPGTFHYVGALGAHRGNTEDDRFPWERLDGRPLIFASLGTVWDTRNFQVLQKITSACAGLDAQLVLTLGRWHDKQGSMRERLGAVPNNVLVVDFAPQLALLDRAAVLITHAGLNSTLESLCRGVPMVALPRSSDQPGVAARIEHSGAGLRTSYHRCTPKELRRLIERVLTEESFRLRAGELREAMIAAGGVCCAAEIVEQALTTRRPVLRA
jgi:MGT family glycosyltransferase